MAHNKPPRKKSSSLQSAILSKLNRSKQSHKKTSFPSHSSSPQASNSIELVEKSSCDIPDHLKRKSTTDSNQENNLVITKKESKSEIEHVIQDDPKPKQIDKLIRKHSSKIKHDTSKFISEFHRIEKQLSQPKLDPLTRHKLILQQKNLGGLEAYQTASKMGGAIEKGGETGKWCAETLIELGLATTVPTAAPSGACNHQSKKIRLLDVGAIDGKSYAKYTDWISATYIDINPIDESTVARYDFFQFPLPKSEDEKFDVVCLSLVLNFVGDLKKRGEMIKRARRFLKPTGKLFIVLPLACLNNSRYLDFKRFRMILNYLGFKVIKQHNSTKLTYWFLEKEDHHSQSHKKDQPTPNLDKTSSSLKFPKVQIRTGPSRNNFCIKV